MNDQVCFKPRPFEAAFLQSGTGYGAFTVLLLVTRKEVFRVVLAAVFLACMLAATVYKGGDYSKLFSLTMFSTILIEAMIVATVSLLRLLLLSHTEDPSKLTDNYSGLIKRYSSEDRFVWKRNGDKEAEAIPVVLEEWLYDKEIRIVDDPDHRYFLPNEIIEHYQELFDAHKTSKIYNSTNIRINDWEYARYKDDTTSEMKMAFTICTGRTTYYSSLVTNRAMDYPLSKGLSARELLEPGPFLHPLKYSSLSNHIGFNGFVISADNNVMFVQRRKDLSIGKRTWGDSIEASLKAKYAFNVNGDYKFTLDGLKKGIELEIVDELGIPRDSLCSPDLMHCNDVLNPICLIAAYRDLLEGGKPQFLFYTRTSLNKDQINTQFNEMIRAKSSQNGTDHIKNENVTKTDGDHLCWVSLDELKQAIVKANGIDVKVIADKADSKKNNGIEHLEMFPSASACVAMLIRYLNYLEDKKQLLPYGMKVRNTEVYKKAKGVADLLK